MHHFKTVVPELYTDIMGHVNHARYFDLFENKYTWGKFREAVTTIRNAARAREVPMAAVVFPLFGLPLDETYPFSPLHRKVGKFLLRREIPVLDLFPEFEYAPLSRIQLIPGTDFHPNELGHRIAAEAMYRWLEEQELIPREFFIREKYGTRLDIRATHNERYANDERNRAGSKGTSEK